MIYSERSRTIRNSIKKVHPEQGRRVFVGMSGGVDSSVAAYLLKKQGYDVIGVYMRCYNLDGCAERDAADARRVAEQIGIPFYVWDFEEEYKQKVVEYMIAGYRRGETPNPDVMCNREVKFGLFLNRALKVGADYVATGHYVRLRRKAPNSKFQIPNKFQAPNSKKLLATRLARPKPWAKEGYSLLAARDTNKDQSYFLWTLNQKQLQHCLFPIGDYIKPQVRAIARRAKLSTADKKDSQGICFLGQVKMEDFLKTRLPIKRGRVVTTTGEKIGEHEGAWFYTIGQRKGLNLGIKNKELRITGETDTKAHYVASKNVRTNTVTVAEGPDHPVLLRKEVTLHDVNFIVPLHIPLRLRRTTFHIPILARIRYRQPVASAKLKVKSQKSKVATLEFDKPQRFVAPGQSAVFYSKKGEMIGGGIIESCK